MPDPVLFFDPVLFLTPFSSADPFLFCKVASLPAFVQYVVYDYEPGPGQAPEFTSDQATSIELFTRARTAIHGVGKQ